MKSTTSRFVMALVTSVVAVLALGVPTVQAAQPSDPGPPNQLPNAVPSTITPSVDDGRVYAIAENGSNMIIGGSFTQVGGQTHQSVAVFDKSTGVLSATFAPTVNGDVNAVLPGPTSTTVYIGGAFTQVNGTPAQFLALLSTTDGSIVSYFHAPAFNYGFVKDLVFRSGRLYVAGTFTTVGGKAHGGLASLNPTTGALDPFVNVQFAGHHNDSGTGAQGWIGPWDIDVTANGATMVVIGNFKTANGLLRDQVALLDLTGSTAKVAAWATSSYSPYCYNWAFDSYVRGVSFSPNGSYFVINATGGGNGTLCDATARFETKLGSTNAKPTWVDETGGDTVWGVTVTNTAVYIGGHNRWNNNPLGVDHAQPGAVPRPGLAALDPVSGRPFAWNPGRLPLGVAVFAVHATASGLWIGSDTDYIGDYKYLRPKLAFFPYAGGPKPAATSTAGLPGTAYLGGSSTIPGDSLTRVAFDGTSATASPADNQGIDFGNWRGAFAVGKRVFYGYIDGYLYYRTLTAGKFGPANKIDPYNDPYWSDIYTGDKGTTFRGMVPSLYGQLPNLTGMFYSGGRLYYTLSGDSHLYSRWFSPDSGILDETTTTSSSSVNFSLADGMFAVGTTLYYGSRDGTLHSVSFRKGTVSGNPTEVSGPAIDGVNWASRATFLTA